MLRTHTCGDLRPSDLGKEVCLQGWVRFSRDHGGVAFIDLADRYGITQVVFDPEALRNIDVCLLNKQGAIVLHSAFNDLDIVFGNMYAIFLEVDR